VSRPSPAVAAANPPAARTSRGALTALSVTMALSSLGTSIANVALPTFARVFGASFPAVQWVVLAYLLAVTALVVSVGRLGDLFGRRRLLLAGITVFTLASAACAMSTGLWMLVAARTAQGAGAAVMMALTLALVGGSVPKERTGRAMGLLGTVSAIGTALGPTVGGLLIARWGWPSIFLLKLPLGALAIVLAYRYLPADRPANVRPSFDVPGSILLALTLAAYALAMTLGRGHVGPLNGALLALAVGGAGLFAFVENRSASPLVHVALFRDRQVRSGFIASGLATSVAMATLVVGPFYLAGALRLGAASVGLVMSAGPLVAALAGVPAGRGVDRFGAPAMTVAGLAAMVAGASALALLPVAFGVPGYVAALATVTGGFAVFQAANNAAVVTGVEAGQRGVVSGLLTLARNLGLVTGASVMGAVFSIAAGTTDVAAAAPRAVAAGTHAAFAVAVLLVIAALVQVARAWQRDHLPARAARCAG
jgi:MFS family permease